MCSTMWFMSVVALLMVHVRTGALQENDIKTIECYSCSPLNRTCVDAPPTARCPSGQHCATTVVVPGMISSLTCATPAGTPCSLNISNNSLQLTCACDSALCNAPFSTELQTQLEKYLPSNTTDITQHFFQNSTFANISEANIYKAITIEIVSTTTVTTNKSNTPPVTVLPVLKPPAIPKEPEKPRAEALKQEPTVPSDDDEDETEGSGSYEDSRVQNHAVSAPAAPSSFLPSEQNSASPLFQQILLPLSFMYFVV